MCVYNVWFEDSALLLQLAVSSSTLSLKTAGSVLSLAINNKYDHKWYTWYFYQGFQVACQNEKRKLGHSHARFSNLGVLFTDKDGSPYSSASQMRTLTPNVRERMASHQFQNYVLK